MLLVAQAGGVGVLGPDAVHGVVDLRGRPVVHLEGRGYPLERVPLHPAARRREEEASVQIPVAQTHFRATRKREDVFSPLLLQGSEVLLEGRANLAQQLHQRMAQEAGIGWLGVEGVGSRSGRQTHITLPHSAFFNSESRE